MASTENFPQGQLYLFEIQFLRWQKSFLARGGTDATTTCELLLVPARPACFEPWSRPRGSSIPPRLSRPVVDRVFTSVHQVGPEVVGEAQAD